MSGDVADAVRAKVASGEYANEREAVAAGLRELFARKGAFEAWLRVDVGSAFVRLRADPGQAEPASTVRARLAAAYAKASTGS